MGGIFLSNPRAGFILNTGVQAIHLNGCLSCCFCLIISLLKSKKNISTSICIDWQPVKITGKKEAVSSYFATDSSHSLCSVVIAICHELCWYRLPIPVAHYLANTIAVVCKSPKAHWNRLHPGGRRVAESVERRTVTNYFGLRFVFILYYQHRLEIPIYQWPYIQSTALPRHRLRATSYKGFYIRLSTRRPR